MHLDWKPCCNLNTKLKVRFLHTKQRKFSFKYTAIFSDNITQSRLYSMYVDSSDFWKVDFCKSGPLKYQHFHYLWFTLILFNVLEKCKRKFGEENESVLKEKFGAQKIKWKS